MAQYTNNQVDSYTTLDTAPDRFSVPVGTCSVTATIVVGVGTTFLTDFKKGDFFFNGTTELLEVDAIYDDTLMYLKYSIAVNLAAGSTVRKVKASRWKQLGWTVIAGAPTINGFTYAVGQSGGSGSMQDSNHVIDPIIINAAGAQVDIVKLTS